MKKELIDFMIWYKNSVPVGTQDNSEKIVNDYLESIEFQAPNERKIIKDNETLKKDCLTCRHSETQVYEYPCSNCSETFIRLEQPA